MVRPTRLANGVTMPLVLCFPDADLVLVQHSDPPSLQHIAYDTSTSLLQSTNLKIIPPFNGDLLG